MIITCEECTTRFKLDDARIPTKGAKVRCSKCKHAFFVKPQAGAGDPVDNAVEQALAEDEIQTQELDAEGDTGSLSGPGDSMERDAAGDSATGLRAPDTQSAQAAMDEFEESDWEFNTEEGGGAEEDLEGFQSTPALDLRADGDPSPDLGNPSSDLGDPSPELGDPSRDLGEPSPDPGDLTDPTTPPGEMEGLDLGGSDDGLLGADAGPLGGDSVPLGGDDGLLGADDTAADARGDSGSSASGDAASAAVDGLLGGAVAGDSSEESSATQPGAVERGIDALLDAGADAAGAAEEPSGLEVDVGGGPQAPAGDPVSAALDGLGLGGDANAAPTAEVPVSAPPVREELGEPGEWDFFGGDGESRAERPPAATAPLVIGRIGVSAEPRARPPVEVDPEPTLAATWARRMLHTAGWAVVSALAALVAFQALWVAPRVVPPAASSQQVAGLEASALEGRWVENRAGQSLFIISGELRSAAGIHTPGARLGVRLLDATGAPLAGEAAVLAAAPSARELRETAPAELLQAQADASLTLAWRAFAPSRAVRFAAVVPELPSAARRFELTASPARRPEPAAVDPQADRASEATPAANAGSAGDGERA